MANDMYTLVPECRPNAQNRSHVAHKKMLQRNPAAGQIACSAIVRPLSKTKKENQHVVIIPSRLFKLTQTSLNAKIDSTQIETIFLNNWVMQYGIPS